MIEQTPAVILAKMRFLARREVGRAPFWICDGPLLIVFIDKVFFTVQHNYRPINSTLPYVDY